MFSQSFRRSVTVLLTIAAVLCVAAYAYGGIIEMRARIDGIGTVRNAGYQKALGSQPDYTPSNG